MKAVKAGFLLEAKGASGREEASQVLAWTTHGCTMIPPVSQILKAALLTKFKEELTLRVAQGLSPGALLAARPAPSPVRLQYGPFSGTRAGATWPQRSTAELTAVPGWS